MLYLTTLSTHFIYGYMASGDLRKRYLSTYYCKHPSVIKLNKLFTKDSEGVLINNCQYLRQCFERMT